MYEGNYRICLLSNVIQTLPVSLMFDPYHLLLIIVAVTSCLKIELISATLLKVLKPPDLVASDLLLG